MVTFQQAYDAAAARYAPEDWASLSQPQVIRVIYEEMRRLDGEDAGAMVDEHLSENKGARTVSLTVIGRVETRSPDARLDRRHRDGRAAREGDGGRSG